MYDTSAASFIANGGALFDAAIKWARRINSLKENSRIVSCDDQRWFRQAAEASRWKRLRFMK